MNKGMFWGIVWILWVCIMPLLLGVHFITVGYTAGAYDINKAKGAINRALTTTDLNEQNRFLQMALEYLKDYSGNPKWWYPTIATDYSVIKQNIQSCIDRNNEVASLNATNYTYQRLVENNLRSYPEINTALTNAVDWQVMVTPTNVIFAIFWILSSIALTIIWIWSVC